MIFDFFQYRRGRLSCGYWSRLLALRLYLSAACLECIDINWAAIGNQRHVTTAPNFRFLRFCHIILIFYFVDCNLLSIVTEWHRFAGCDDFCTSMVLQVWPVNPKRQRKNVTCHCIQTWLHLQPKQVDTDWQFVKLSYCGAQFQTALTLNGVVTG